MELLYSANNHEVIMVACNEDFACRKAAVLSCTFGHSHSQQEVSLESTSGQKVKALFYSKNIILRPFTRYAHAHEQAPTRTHASACTYLHSPHIYDYEIEVITERFHFVGRWIHLS